MTKDCFPSNTNPNPLSFKKKKERKKEILQEKHAIKQEI